MSDEPKCIICGATEKIIHATYANRKGYVVLCYPHRAKLIYLMNSFMDGKQIFIRTVLKQGIIKEICLKGGK